MFADPVALERGLDALFLVDESRGDDGQVVGLSNLELDRATLRLTIDFEGNRGPPHRTKAGHRTRNAPPNPQGPPHRTRKARPAASWRLIRVPTGDSA